MDNENKELKRRRSPPGRQSAIKLLEKPEAQEIYLLAGWRQWADAGTVSSGFPRYLVQQTGARSIGQIHPEGFFIFQIPGTHDLLRPGIKFNQGYPEKLDTNRTEIFYTGDESRGFVILIGDEPHLDIERYSASFLQIARELKVRRIISLGGVYGELPYDRERPLHGIVSKPDLREELKKLSVTPSEYEGGASIGSYICKRAGDNDIEMVGLYAFVPTYDFSAAAPAGGVIRIENDFGAWLAVARRLNQLIHLNLDLSDLEIRRKQLTDAMDAKIAEIDSIAPQLGVVEYLKRLSQNFDEKPFNPDEDFWEEKLRGLFGDEEDE